MTARSYFPAATPIVLDETRWEMIQMVIKVSCLDTDIISATVVGHIPLFVQEKMCECYASYMQPTQGH